MTLTKKLLISLFVLSTLFACRTSPEQVPPVTDPSVYYGSDLYHDIQMAHLFPDSKTFSDATAKRPIEELIKVYGIQKETEGFDLEVFIDENYIIPQAFQANFKSDPNRSMEEHIQALWSELTRDADIQDPNASLLPLPQRYIVPGGRFREIYYWDSHFTMEGLVLHDAALAESMVDNFAYLIDKLGFIPNGNRTYYLTRSQPPFFSLMVDAISRNDRQKILKYLPQLEKEYTYWMSDDKVVQIDGIDFNTYHDLGITPRPESHREDFELAKDLASQAEKEKLYSNLRTGAMSGWDYSSRWFADNQHLATIEIADIVPVDLNCLLFKLESMIAEGYALKNDQEKQENYVKLAESRKQNIQNLFWNEEIGFFEDYHFKKQAHTGRLTLAGAFPLFLELASPEQANASKTVLVKEFLQAGGFVTTLQNTGEQWDAPNGWAPLQWVCIQGLKNYGYDDIANDASRRWLRINRKVYQNTGKMMEKYNVMDTTLVGGGGEYPNQDGFGWTNGVAMALLEQLQE